MLGPEVSVQRHTQAEGTRAVLCPSLGSGPPLMGPAQHLHPIGKACVCLSGRLSPQQALRGVVCAWWIQWGGRGPWLPQHLTA